MQLSKDKIKYFYIWLSSMIIVGIKLFSLFWSQNVSEPSNFCMQVVWGICPKLKKKKKFINLSIHIVKELGVETISIQKLLIKFLK